MDGSSLWMEEFDLKMHNDEELELILDNPAEIIRLVKVQKNEGNCLFKDGKFELAFAKYDKAMRLFSLGLPMSTEDEDEYRSLMVSLSLNLAACALKLQQFDLARDHCTFVLEYDPTNVKALFRRASSLMNLDLPIEAHSDLVKASFLDAKDKDVARELGIIESWLKGNLNGKRCLSHYPDFQSDRKGKRVTIDTIAAGSSSCVTNDELLTSDSCEGPAMPILRVSSSNCSDKASVCVEPTTIDSSEVSQNNEEAESMLITPDSKEVLIAQELSLSTPASNQVNSTSGKAPSYQYLNKRRNQSLDIPPSVYKKVVKGHNVSFYQPSSMSLMTIRVHHAVLDTGEKGIQFCATSAESMCTDSMCTDSSTITVVKEIESVSEAVVMEYDKYAHECDNSVVMTDCIEGAVVLENADIDSTTSVAQEEYSSACGQKVSEFMATHFVFSSMAKSRNMRRSSQYHHRFCNHYRSSSSVAHIRPKVSKLLKHQRKQGSRNCFSNSLWFCRDLINSKRKSPPYDDSLASSRKKIKYYISSLLPSGFDGQDYVL